MASKTQIINRAFHHLGVSRIDNPAEGEPQSVTVEDVYTADLESLLAAHSWKFATKWEVLPKLVEGSGSLFWRYGFQVPTSPFQKIRITDVRQVGTDCRINDYDYNGGVIMCNYSDIYIKYITFVTDPNAMSPLFRELLSLKLAMSICIPTTNSMQLLGSLEQKFTELESKAVSVDTSDDAMDPIPQSSWVTEFYAGA